MFKSEWGLGLRWRWSWSRWVYWLDRALLPVLCCLHTLIYSWARLFFIRIWSFGWVWSGRTEDARGGLTSNFQMKLNDMWTSPEGYILKDHTTVSSNFGRSVSAVSTSILLTKTVIWKRFLCFVISPLSSMLFVCRLVCRDLRTQNFSKTILWAVMLLNIFQKMIL